MFHSSDPFSSSIHGFSPPSGIFFGHEKDGVYFNHHPFLTGNCSFEHFSQNYDNNHNHLNLSDSMMTFPSRNEDAASKKDRSSKIFTAQGPRVRRVRLSIDISRKFFGLQDLLGFDKASKTLDWLFMKSKTAIKDLVEEMKHTSCRSALTDQCEQVFLEKGDHVQKGRKKKFVNGNKNKKKTTQKLNSGFRVSLADRLQLRAEARARARERTIEKLQIKKLNHESSNDVLDDRNYPYPQSCFGDQIQSQSNHELKLWEPYDEQKLPMSYSLMYSSQHNFLESEDSTFQFPARQDYIMYIS